jgi:hypothetical protein
MVSWEAATLVSDLESSGKESHAQYLIDDVYSPAGQYRCADVEYIPWEGYSLPAYRVSLVISHHASRIMK